MSVVEFGFNVVICVVAWLIVVWVFKKTPFYKRNEDHPFLFGDGLLDNDHYFDGS